MKQVFAYLQDQEQAYLAELFAFIRCAGISATGKNMPQAAAMLSKMMQKSGVEHVCVLPTDGYPVVYGDILRDPRLPTLLIYGHYDVQSADDKELWKSDPFEPVIVGDRIYGRGAADNKAQLFAQLKGGEAYRKVKGELPINLKYIFEGEEEIGSPSLLNFAQNNRELLKSDVCIYSDGCYHDNGDPILVLGVKGSFYAEITLQGVCKETHAMRAPCLPNPAWRMVELLRCLQNERGEILIDGFFDTVRPLLPLEAAAGDKIPVDVEGLKAGFGVQRLLGDLDGRDYYKRLIFQPAVNIAGIFGGYTGQGFRNIIPQNVTVRIDVSLVPEQQPEDIYAKLRQHLDRCGFTDATMRVVGGMFRPARTPVDNPYVDVARKAVYDGFGREPVVFPSVGGAAPNYVFIDHLGIPMIGIPYAGADQNNHVPNENILLSSFKNGLRTSAALIERMGEYAQASGTITTTL